MISTDHTWVSVDGLKLYARAYGAPRVDKLPVICIPGLTRNSRDFEEVAPWIAERGRYVLAVDLRGRGKSDRDPDPRRYTPRIYARDVSALLGSVGAKKAVFVGTSLGGLVIMAIAAAPPSIIGAAVIHDTGPQIGKPGIARIRSYAGKRAAVNTWAEAAAYAKAINGVAFPDLPDEAWTNVARRLFKEEHGRPVLDYDPLIFQSPNLVAAWLAQPLLWSAFDRLSRSGPLLLVHGELTDILDAESIRRMRRRAPHMLTAVVPRVGHAPTLFELAAREALSAFVDRAP